MKRWILAVAALSLSSFSTAWDGFGHKVVATIAYDQLTPKAKAKIDLILQSHPGTLADGNTKVDFKNFVNAATWPDEIRMTSLSHPTWHYVDFPFSVGSVTGPAPDAVNLLTQLTESILEAKKAKPDAELSKHISWIEHLVGDMHQPLHCVSLYDSAHLPPKGDKGGNGFIFNTGKGKKLHSYWDKALELKGGTVQSVATAAEALSVGTIPALPTTKAGINAKLTEWAQDSFGLAKTEVYRRSSGANAPMLTEHVPLPSNYANRAYKIALKQAALAGRRLAAILNAIYG